MVRVFTKIEEDPAIGRHGQVFTKPHVVALILDLCGYRASLPLHETRLLDPGCGDGAFIAEALARLLKSLPAGTHPDSLSDCLLAVEKDPALAQRSRERLERQLIQFGFKHSVARKLSKGWVANEDFLASETVGQFDFVVGNPPYVRQEAIPRLTWSSTGNNSRASSTEQTSIWPLSRRACACCRRRGCWGSFAPTGSPATGTVKSSGR